MATQIRLASPYASGCCHLVTCLYRIYFTGCLFDKKRARLRFKLAFLHEFFKIKTYHKNIELYNFAFVEYFKRKFLYYFDEKIRFIRSWFREQEIYNHP